MNSKYEILCEGKGYFKKVIQKDTATIMTPTRTAAVGGKRRAFIETAYLCSTVHFL